MKNSMIWLLVTLTTVYGDESVRLLSKTTSLTSSTLRWVHGSEAAIHKTEILRGSSIRPRATDADYAADATTEDDDEQEEEAEVTEVDDEAFDERSVLVCRARHNGETLPGVLIDGMCKVSLAKQVAEYKRYDVLRNIENSARLQWRNWTRFNGKPFGAISAGNLGYVVRRRAPPDSRYSHYLGRLDMGVGLGRVFVMEPVDSSSTKWTEKDYFDGEVLVESEPVEYELRDVHLNNRRIKLQQRPRVLATTILRHELDYDESNDATDVPSRLVATAMTYWQEPSSEYWGQGSALLRGLKTMIYMPNEEKPHLIAWGVNSTQPGSEQAVTVQAKLPPGTAQNVSITGNHTYSEVPYTAKLIAHYRDKKTRERTINGTLHQVSLQGVKIIYGAHYFLHDGSLVPTTTTTSTTPSTTTTVSTTTTTTTTVKSVAANQILDKQDTTEIYHYSDKSNNAPQILSSAPPNSSTIRRNSSLLIITLLLVIAFRNGT